jgi:hypothetical protein
MLVTDGMCLLGCFEGFLLLISSCLTDRSWRYVYVHHKSAVYIVCVRIHMHIFDSATSCSAKWSA